MTDEASRLSRPNTPYGYELVLDLHHCNTETFNRESLDRFFTRLCTRIDMRREVVHFWDDLGVPEDQRQTLPHTKGTSAVCFILTSSIVVHTLDLLAAVYLNIFSCKEYDPEVVRRFAGEWFAGDIVNSTFIERM